MSDKQWIPEVGGMYFRTPSKGRFKGEKVYCGRVWIKSEQRFRHFVLGTALKKAKKRLAEIQVDPERAIKDKKQSAVRLLTFAQVVAEFQKVHRSRGGTDYYAHILKAPLAFIGSRPTTEIAPSTIDRYLERRRAEKRIGRLRKVNGETVRIGTGPKVGESTLRKEVGAIKKVMRWARYRAMMPDNPVADYERPDEPGEHTIAILSPEQEAVLFQHVPAWVSDVVEWAIYSGMRRGELLSLQWKSIDRRAGVVHVMGTKTGKTRKLPLSLSARLPAILDRHPQRIGSQLLFHDPEGGPLDLDELNRVLEAAEAAAGIPKERGVMWNRYRHTFATRLASSGKIPSTAVLAKIMGNSVAVCEKHYLGYFPGQLDGLTGALDSPTVPPAVPQAGFADPAAAAS